MVVKDYLKALVPGRLGWKEREILDAISTKTVLGREMKAVSSVGRKTFYAIEISRLGTTSVGAVLVYLTGATEAFLTASTASAYIGFTAVYNKLSNYTLKSLVKNKSLKPDAQKELTDLVKN